MDSTISVIRPSDHLVLVVEFRGVDFTPPAGNQPGEVRGAANAFLILRFQPQHIHEQAFFQPGADLPPASPKDASDTTADPPLPPGIVQSRLSGPSRLVFTVPPAEKFPYTLEGLLAALERLPLSVSPVSAYNPELTGCLPLDLLRRAFSSPQPPHVAPPAHTHTAIEVPYRLILSPDDFAVWSHASKPVTHADWTELWHTRLASRRNADPRIRAIWSPDFIAKEPANPLRVGQPDVSRSLPCLARCARSKRDRPPDLEPLHRRLHPLAGRNRAVHAHVPRGDGQVRRGVGRPRDSLDIVPRHAHGRTVAARGLDRA